ncbi:MAG: UvrD-helicase domain-containing protein [Alphaproteobacteria bacterium]|nr:UvrD-helicase domain-containing protein [Alphaproteobacteria bacterium]
MSKKQPLSPEQDIAANPNENVWVQANAGTGKTSVLIQRLLRILFRVQDLNNSGILCLTYTNAAAGEMRNRILSALRTWAMADDDALRELLVDICTNNTPTNEDIETARKIFFKYIDSPEILKIKTIHGFCEEILRRFPIEAGISPVWSLVSDDSQRVLLHQSLEQLLNNQTNDPKTQNAFDRIVSVISEHRLDNLLEYIGGQYKHFFLVNDFDNYRKYFIENIKKILNIPGAKTLEKDIDKLKNIVNYAKDVKKPGEKLKKLINLTEQYIENTIDFEKYKTAYLTTPGTPIKSGLTYDFLTEERERVFEQNQQNINQSIFDDTVALFDLSAAFAKIYQTIKQKNNVLDFEDLILYTHRLFSNPETMGWVLSQLDISLSHILVDEAQDTGPLQWALLRMLAGDFFAEGDNTNTPRSLFVVGDTKQSIYGFQGADPEAFASSREEIASYIKNNARQIREVPLTQSFRSTEPILQTVDKFFGNENLAKTVGFLNNPHKCFRKGEPGLVEIHGLVSGKTDEDIDSKKNYIKNIADKIESIITQKEHKPKDIMILVQQRHPYAAIMSSELKRRNIPVAGSDRVVLPNFPVIKDFMNLLRFCINQSDDYSLACVLKSPVFALDDNEIYKICVVRNQENKSLVQTNKDAPKIPLIKFIEKPYPDIYNSLQDLIELAQTAGPYKFFTHLLDKYDVRRKMIACLGTEIIDPLNEFMTICLAYERTKPGTLKHFLKWFITGASEVKRDMDSDQGVRIVTVHGSKGLQSPVVFLIDTVSMPKSENIYNIDNNNSYPLWIWTAHKPKEFSSDFCEIDEAQKHKDIEESFRLLYVAMTRACDELYIYGFSPYTNAPELSWHNTLWQTLSNEPDITVADNTIRISNYDK